MISCILLAAGRGKRFGRKKQFITIKGKPLFMYSVETVRQLFDEIILVLPEEDIKNINVPQDVKKVAGGEERQDSVLNALLETEAETVVIHDTARPFATREMFTKVSDLGDYDGKIVAVPSRDTLKEVAEDIVVRTIDRSGIWLAQTPQAFKRKILLECHFKARNEGFYGTDDASLLERYGYKIGVIEGSYWNFKVTYPEDISVLEKLIGGGGGTRTLTGL